MKEKSGATARKSVGYKIKIKQPTKQGYIECSVPGIFDASYPSSKNRRGRVQGGGKIVPALCAGQSLLVYIDVVWRG